MRASQEIANRWTDLRDALGIGRGLYGAAGDAANVLGSLPRQHLPHTDPSAGGTKVVAHVPYLDTRVVDSDNRE